MSKQFDNSSSASFPKSNSWVDDDDEFMSAVSQDAKFTKNTQPSPTWQKAEPKDRRAPASTPGLSWSMPNPVPQSNNSNVSSPTGMRFDSLAPRRPGTLGTWRK